MPYTLLRVTDAGVVLCDYHLRRLELSGQGAAHEAFLRFARETPPGVWALWSDAAGLRTEPRPGSRLRDGIAVRCMASPVLEGLAALPKPAPPGPYDTVRSPGVATLLTSADGREVLEACCAAVVGWDGERIVCAPSCRPRVWSTAEAAIRDHLPVREAPLSASSEALLLVNAVKGTCALANPFGRAFPLHVRQRIDELLVRLTKRPEQAWGPAWRRGGP
jgi:hypothetical protein